MCLLQVNRGLCNGGPKSKMQIPRAGDQPPRRSDFVSRLKSKRYRRVDPLAGSELGRCRHRTRSRPLSPLAPSPYAVGVYFSNIKSGAWTTPDPTKPYASTHARGAHPNHAGLGPARAVQRERRREVLRERTRVDHRPPPAIWEPFDQRPGVGPGGCHSFGVVHLRSPRTTSDQHQAMSDQDMSDQDADPWADLNLVLAATNPQNGLPAFGKINRKNVSQFFCQHF